MEAISSTPRAGFTYTFPLGGFGAPSPETQVSAPGNVGFHTTGQQPDSVGDHEQVGTHAPVRGATGKPEAEGTEPQTSPDEEKGAETVGAAK